MLESHPKEQTIHPVSAFYYPLPDSPSTGFPSHGLVCILIAPCRGVPVPDGFIIIIGPQTEKNRTRMTKGLQLMVVRKWEMEEGMWGAGLGRSTHNHGPCEGSCPEGAHSLVGSETPTILIRCYSHGTVRQRDQD